MITTGAKLFIGATVLALIGALAYGLVREGVLGTIGLISAVLVLAFLAGVAIYTRDATVMAADAGATTDSPAARQAPRRSPWPLLSVIGVVAVLIGLVTYPVVVILGLVVLLGGVAEWMVQAWAERGSSDEAYNDEIRSRLASPLETPILAAVFVVFIIYAFSRVMLTLTKQGSIAALVAVAAVALIVAALLARKPGVPLRTAGGVIAVATLVLAGAGIAGALNGERSMHVIETTADLAERGRCGTEASEADEKFSQTVGAKSSAAATLVLGDDGSLLAEMPGDLAPSRRLTLPRSNDNNVLFRNESSQARRLVIDTGPQGPDGQNRVFCTALVEPGGVQVLTLEIAKPTYAVDGGHQFVVPGVDTAVVELTVP